MNPIAQNTMPEATAITAVTVMSATDQRKRWRDGMTD